MDTKKKPKLHYAWLVLFMCCMMFGAAMGIYGNCAALYTAPLLKDLGWTYTTVSVIGIVATVSRMAASGVAYKVFKKYPLKLILSVSIVMMMTACSIKAYLNDIFLYIIINFLVGVSGAFLLYIPIPMLINNWFAEKRETALSIAMLSSGLAGAVLSPVFNSVIESRGWRYATMINGIVGLLVALPPILLFAVKSPEEKGLRPYGYKEPGPMKVYTSPSEYFENNEHPDYDTRFSVAEKKRRFILSLLLAMFLCGASVFPSRLSHFATTSGIGSSVGALMLSLAMIGNMASKALMGPLCDRFGPRRTYTFSVTAALAAFLIFCLMPSSNTVLLAAAFLSGISAGNNMMVYPSAVRTYAKGDEYTSYIAKISIGMTFFGTPFGLLISGIYDITQSYRWIFIVFFALEAVCLFMTLRMFPREKKIRESF